MIRTRVASISNDIELAVSALLSPEAQSRAVAEFAREAIDGGDRQNAQALGRIPRRVVSVDGRDGAQLESVRPDGRIIAEWTLGTDVMRFIADTLLALSPEESGDYKRAHTLFADGQEIPLGGEIPDAAEYVFVNPLPYSRVIELSARGGKPIRIEVGGHVYERTAEMAKRRFSKIANIRFTFRGIVSGHMFGKTGPRTSAKAGRTSKPSNAADARFPAIVVRMR